MAGAEFTVTVPDGRLDLPLCVRSGQAFRWKEASPEVWLGGDGSDWYRVQLGGGELRVQASTDEAAFRSYFRLDWDGEDIEADILRLAPQLEQAMCELRGLRLLRPADPVEVFYSFLCTPNNNLPRITGMVRQLARSAPVLERLDGEVMHAFPGTEVVAALDEGLLREKAFGYRAATIPSVAKQVLARGGDGYIRSLKTQSYEEAHRQLMSLTGIGPKLADCICLFGLDKTEAVPVDTHIWQAATRLFFPEWQGLSLTGQRYRTIGDALRDRFGKLAGWAQQYLFYENLKNWRSRA